MQSVTLVRYGGHTTAGHIAGHIDLIVPRVIIMEGRTQLSSRSCGTNLVLRRCLDARRVDG